MKITPTCSANTAELKFAFIESDDFNIRVRIDYICIEKSNVKVGGQFSAMSSHSRGQDSTTLLIDLEFCPYCWSVPYHTVYRVVWKVAFVTM